MIDWGAGHYERTAVELEPVSQSVVTMAAVSPAVDVVDLACGTGNAALLAAQRGARVVGVDASTRLLGVARRRAQAQGVAVDLRQGDLLDLPLVDGSADVLLSVFGVIFAADPGLALREVRRVCRPGGRVFITAWVPAGPIDAMVGVAGRVLARLGQPRPPQRFAWSDPAALDLLAAGAGLKLHTTTSAELAIRDRSPEAYVLAGQDHPMALATRSVIQRAGVATEVQEGMIAVLREANEDPSGFLVHSPYVVHELRVD